MNTQRRLRVDAKPAARWDWVAEALRLINAESLGDRPTPLFAFDAPVFGGVRLFLKDESCHPTGSLKHRLARSLFVQALSSGSIGPTTPIIEASSGSTAVSEAYFARIIGVPFIAVIPASTSPEKIALISRHGGQCLTVDDPTAVVVEARRIAAEIDGYFMDQFTFAAQATNWRSDNIAEEIFEQMIGETGRVPDWVVVGAGTGGTSTCIARHARYRALPVNTAVVDPEGSAFYDGWRLRDTSITTTTPSRIEGIGRTRVEPSFVPNLIDEMFQVPDAASIAAMRWASEALGRRVGPSTGTNIWGSILLAQRMRTGVESGTIVSLICDEGERYASTYYDDDWLSARGIDIRPALAALRESDATGRLEFS